MENKEPLNPNEIKANVDLGLENSGNSNSHAETSTDESASESVPVAKKRKTSSPTSLKNNALNLREPSLEQSSNDTSNGLEDYEKLSEGSPSETASTEEQAQLASNVEVTAKPDIMVVEGDDLEEDDQDNALAADRKSTRLNSSH